MFVRKKECLTGRNNVCQESIMFERQVVGRMFLPIERRMFYRIKNVCQVRRMLMKKKMCDL